MMKKQGKMKKRRRTSILSKGQLRIVLEHIFPNQYYFRGNAINSTYFGMNLQQQFFAFASMMTKKKVRHSSEKLIFHKIHFTVRRRVKFGEAVYVCGSTPELGLWNPEKAFRLKWNEGDSWTGTLLLTSKIPLQIEYKYVVASWENPSCQRCQWEIGGHNRKADLSQAKPLTFIGTYENNEDERWNMDQISLYLVTKRSKSPQSQRYYVSGSIPELGAWKDRKLLKKNLNSYIENHLNITESQNLSYYSNKENQIWTFSFEIFRLQTQFYYYYMRRGDITQNQRKPGRIFKFGSQEALYPCRKTVIHPRGYIFIIDQSSIDELKLSKITSTIYVGNYVKTMADIEKLKQNNVTTILSIQSEKDYKKNGVSPYYLQTLCKQNNIIFRRISIEDMNKSDFISRAEEGVRIMDEALKEEGKIYVHCTAGIYRSPQMIAMYLAAFKKYNIQDAVALLKERHSYAQPSYKTIQEALKIMKERQRLRG